ncbi:MAG: PIN domain-containing protein [Propionibacteriaceae bacterium]|jgi:tRNA(fMet)-specific endonuclease VapC|nr:PIN domain-containing protein [Propionibacteriaceae bacterium]
MSLHYLLDSDTLITLLRRRHQLAADRFAAAVGRIGVSSISVFELARGLAGSTAPDRERGAYEDLLSRVTILPFDRAAAEHAGQIDQHLKAKGLMIGVYDRLLAGHARSLALTMVTNNTREFERVPGLMVENWLAG